MFSILMSNKTFQFLIWNFFLVLFFGFVTNFSSGALALLKELGIQVC